MLDNDEKFFVGLPSDVLDAVGIIIVIFLMIVITYVLLEAR